MRSWYKAIDLQEQLQLHADSLSTVMLSEDEDELQLFLDSLLLLKGLPISYIVPDEALLPPESLRVFWIDEAWVSAYLDGALSVGRNSSKDRLHDAQIFKSAVCKAGGNKGLRMGFLLRSRLVNGWPGMELETRAREGEPLSILRLEVLGEEVLLGIVEGELGSLTFTEPNKVRHFGAKDLQEKYNIPLISMKAGEEGKELGKSLNFVFRDEKEGVVDVAGFAKAMGESLQEAQALSGEMSPASFAAEMVYRRERIRIDITCVSQKEELHGAVKYVRNGGEHD